MAAEADLDHAAMNIFTNLGTKASATWLTKIQAFITAISVGFDVNKAGNQTGGDWIAVLSMIAATFNNDNFSGHGPGTLYRNFNLACRAIAGLCGMGGTNGPGGIPTNTLVAYNANF